jgi:hypothetical protein
LFEAALSFKSMNSILKITLWSLYVAILAGLILPLAFSNESTANIANAIMSTVPAWVAYSIVVLFLVTGSIAEMARAFRKEKPPAFLVGLVSRQMRDKIESKCEQLFLFSQVFFCLWSIYFLASLYV